MSRQSYRSFNFPSFSTTKNPVTKENQQTSGKRQSFSNENKKFGQQRGDQDNKFLFMALHSLSIKTIQNILETQAITFSSSEPPFYYLHVIREPLLEILGRMTQICIRSWGIRFR